VTGSAAGEEPGDGFCAVDCSEGILHRRRACRASNMSSGRVCQQAARRFLLTIKRLMRGQLRLVGIRFA
jgi:hypothetical protein